MLEQAWAEGIEMNWVTGDTLYGNSASFRHGIRESGHHYVLAVTQNHKVSCQGWQRIDALATKLSPDDWSITTKRQGGRAHLVAQWACLRVGFDEQEQWLIFRQTQHELEAYLSNAPETSPAETLIQVILARHGTERSLQEAKSDLGLADYEVRYFHAWLRHMTLCLLAHTFLALCRQQRKKNVPASVRYAQFR